MSAVTYREAVRRAIRDAMRADPNVFLMGEDVGRYGGSFAVSKGLLEDFGDERIRDIVEGCRRVADASGGGLAKLIGIGSGVSGEEASVLDAITKKLRAGGPRR